MVIHMKRNIDLRQSFQEAKDARDRGDYNGALNKMRAIAELAAALYVELGDLKASYKMLEGKPENRKKKAFLLNIYTLRRATPFHQDRYRRDLLTFLDLARKYGNMGSHELVQADHIYADFLLRFYEDNIRNVLERDYMANYQDMPFADVTQRFHGRTIFLLSAAADQFASAYVELDDAPVQCTASEPSGWEAFHVEVDGGGWACLRAFNDRFLTVRIDQDAAMPPLRATAEGAEAWERFKIFQNGDRYCLKAQANGKWITARIDMDGAPLFASCDKVDHWETFSIQTL